MDTAGSSSGVNWTEWEPALCVRSEDCARNIISVLPTSASRGAPDADTFSVFMCYSPDVTFECTEYKEWGKVKHNYIIIIICSYVVEGS